MKEPMYLEPGGYIVGRHLEQCYKTILGSCVSVIMWEPEQSFAAMCHFLLPFSPERDICKSAMKPLGYYGAWVLPEMLHQAKLAGVDISKLLIFTFGGASSERTQALSQRFRIACNNLTYTEKFLRQHGLKPKCQDVGGVQGRSLTFDAASGKFICQKIDKSMTGGALCVKK